MFLWPLYVWKQKNLKYMFFLSFSLLRLRNFSPLLLLQYNLTPLRQTNYALILSTPQRDEQITRAKRTNPILIPNVNLKI